MPQVNVEAMNEHLMEISQCVSAGAIAVLVLDGASLAGIPRHGFVCQTISCCYRCLPTRLN
jgi:hypothetical protein